MTGSHVSYVGKSKLQQGPGHESHTWGGGVLPAERSAAPPRSSGSKALSSSSTEQLFFQVSGQLHRVSQLVARCTARCNQLITAIN